MRKVINELLVVGCMSSALVIGCANAVDANISIEPANIKQVVKFGSDVKLTLKGVAEGNTEAILDRFEELNMDLIRVPIYTTRQIDDPFYEKVYQVSQLAKARGMTVFASVANGDGDQNNNLHGSHKFDSSFFCNCPYNLYSLNLTKYASYLDNYLTNMENNGAKVDILGPYNEDGAVNSDYKKIWDQMISNDFQRIGVETYALNVAPSKYAEISDQIDIAGAHFYDDVSFNRSSHQGVWENFVNATGATPAWFTESTRISVGGQSAIENTVSGIEHIIPAIQAGIERVIIYQTANRLVKYNGEPVPYKFSAFKQFVSTAVGNVIASSVDTDDLRTVTFRQGNTLNINITNPNPSNKVVQLNLGNFKTDGLITRTIWTDGSEGVANSYTLTNNSKWNMTVPAGSYVHLEVPIR